LFEMPLKTQAGKVKRKIVKATNEQAAIKAAGQSYTLIRKLTEGEKPKVGTMDMEGYVAPPKRGRGRPKGVKNKAKAPSKPSEMPSKKSQAAIKAKSEDIGEGIAIADKTMRGSLEYVFDALANLNQHIGKMEREVESMQVEVAKLIGVKPPNQYARGGKTSMVNDYQRERGDIKKASEAMNDHLDKVGMSLFDESRPKSGVYRTMLGRYGWTDFDADVNSKEEFLFESDAIEDFTKYLKKAYPAGKKMAHGGMHGQGYDDKLDESLGMRKGAGRSKQQSRKDRRDESAGMEKSMGRRKYASVGTMDKGRRTMEKGGLAIHFDSDKTNKDEIENLLMDKSYMNDNEYLTDYGSSFYIYADDISPRGVRDAYESIIEDGYDENVELELFAKGGSTEGKPKVESLEEVFLLMDGTEIEYKDIDDAEKMFGGDPLSPQELVDKLAFEGIFVMDYAPELFDLPDGDDEDDDEDYTGNVKDGVTIDDIEDAIEDLLKADNSYNYSAPFVFDVRFNETRDAYDPQVMIVREHRGGDVRGNYGPAMAFYLDNIESNPFYGKMSVEIQTDKGRISLDAESLEGYNFYVNRDETGTFEQDSTIDRDEIAEAFDFGKVKSETLYIND